MSLASMTSDELSTPEIMADLRILKLTPVPSIILDSNLRILQASQSFLGRFNLTDLDCCGIDIFSFLAGRSAVLNTHTVRRSLDTAIATRSVSSADDVVAADGTCWSIRTVPIFDQDALRYVVLEARDTTAGHLRRQALGEALDENETYRILVETVKDYAIFMMDTRGYIMTWNAGASLLKGYDKGEIVGKHFSVFYSEEDRISDKPDKELVIAVRDGKLEDEGWRYRKNKSRFWANVIITAVYRNNVHIGFSKVTRDLTERKAAEAKLIAAYEESDKLKSDFLANMSHEIRTPMHGMLSALSLLMDTPLTAEQKELGSIISESGSILLQVIDDLLDYSKLASGGFSITSDVMNVSKIVLAVARGLQTTLKPDVRLETSLEPNLPLAAEGDPLRYRQIVQNLVANATKFTESGSMRIRTALKEQDLTSYTILTEVTDTGIGVPAFAARLLFTPFSQFDNSATKRYKGTGLGLSICKSLAELMGGRIGFRPNPAGQGSIFWFTAKLQKLPEAEPPELVETESAPAHPPAHSDPQMALRAISRRKCVLLAEDNPINQKVMLKMLRGFGFENLDTATDGAQAVRMAVEKQPPYDVILMDINMPILDGVGALAEIRRAGINIPAIAMTANALKGDAERFLTNGFCDYVSKPIDRKLLLKALLTRMT